MRIGFDPSKRLQRLLSFDSPDFVWSECYRSGVISQKHTETMAKNAKLLRRIPHARRVPSLLTRRDVTRGEYSRIIDILNERAVILNEFRDAINELRHASEIQFKRIAQIQADLDVMKPVRDKMR